MPNQLVGPLRHSFFMTRLRYISHIEVYIIFLLYFFLPLPSNRPEVGSLPDVYTQFAYALLHVGAFVRNDCWVVNVRPPTAAYIYNAHRRPICDGCAPPKRKRASVYWKEGKKLYIHIRRIISRRRPSGADVVGVQRRKLFRLYGWSPQCSYASIRVGIITHLSFPFSYYLFSCSLRLSSLQPTAIYFSSYFLFFFFS